MSRKRDPLELFDANDGQNPQLLLDKCLVRACCEGDIDTVIDLLQKGASVEAGAYTEHEALSGENYTTPLMGAAQASKQQHKIASLLLENGADVNVGDRYSVTPLHAACVNGHRDCVRLFIDAGANVNAGTLDYNRPGVYRKPYRGGSTPLHLAARDSQVACLEELLAHGHADYNRRDALGCTCLNWAAQSASEECVLTILGLSEGTQVFSASIPGTGDFPLHDCVRRGLVKSVRELLLRGADVNQQNAIGLSPLHFAAVPSQNFSPEMMETLVTNAQDLDVDQPIGGCNPTHYRHGMSGIKPLQLVAFDPDMDIHLHTFHTAEFRLSRTFKLMTSDPRRPVRRPQCAVHLIRHGADFCLSYQGRTLLQQEVYSQDGADDSLLTAMVRAAGTLPVPDSPPGMLAEDISKGAKEKLKWLRETFRSPRSLQQYCRVAVRRLLGRKRLNRVTELPLPSSLQDYLLLKT
ncbi:serine/threonine-protein phosphatase 6 regulatory ankyrin repeat subunit A-like [Acanthaster planci]|uniref:Serine/threonine-protein phosphatase 6 regulatory ankyrin repeat subunit A-like n=1 Tax=Acanthaster planci TaxID=133434 RepID=A0A8B7Y3N1_ACAPL|nr:serine/threonine-protein phosphatase 6 regulatory ankyrin repeat subunit A-like [Acanthaster planci]